MRAQRARQWREARWPERWFDRLATHYQTPAAVLERLLAPGDLRHEIARLIAETVVREASALGPTSDARERQRRMRRRLALKRSEDWLDALIIERWRLDETRRAAQKDS